MTIPDVTSLHEFTDDLIFDQASALTFIGPWFDDGEPLGPAWAFHCVPIFREAAALQSRLAFSGAGDAAGHHDAARVLLGAAADAVRFLVRRRVLAWCAVIVGDGDAFGIGGTDDIRDAFAPDGSAWSWQRGPLGYLAAVRQDVSWNEGHADPGYDAQFDHGRQRVDEVIREVAAILDSVGGL